MENNLLIHESVSQMGTEFLDFQFPAMNTGTTIPNDIVFCGKTIVRRTEPAPPPKNPFLSRSESFGKLILGRTSSGLNSGPYKRLHSIRYSKGSSTRQRYSGLFGILRFPLQMELSDIKERQRRREPVTLPAFPGDGDGESVSGGGGKSCWELVRPLRRRSHLMTALAKASFGCIPVV
ncbi:hypothetical protein L6164_007262 [Bauhinia variegata]|uniref:Uncharacterized protein n=1 Tax=Bauhinia variegata TaxID=167791 RepID=A0ACB9PDB1_BAUVA|nr:hypothetical protein L6164_007262 [Bauhinia variegata]